MKLQPLKNAVCFGSLAQRSPGARAAIRALLAGTRPQGLRVFDVNLRQHFFSPEVITSSLELATVLKINDQELPVLAEMFHLRGDTFEQLKELALRFQLSLVALTRGARTLALQVVEGNAPAIHLYEKYGFGAIGAVTYYQRPSVRIQPLWHDVSSAGSTRIRNAGWSDRENVWQATLHNIPSTLTYAEPFDRNIYRLGLRWTLSNFFNANCEQWLVAESEGKFKGAVRARVNFELSEHHLELMLSPSAAPR